MRGYRAHLLSALLLLASACAARTPTPPAPQPASSNSKPRPVSERYTEADPEYWLAKLDTGDQRARAIKLLEQFFEDAATRSNLDLSAPDVKRLIDLSVEPLTRAYVTYFATLDARSRLSLIKLLVSYEDKRAAPAFAKALHDFAKNAPTSKDESDIKWAARGITKLKLDSLAMPLLDAFNTFSVSSQLGGVSYRDLNRAMVAIPNKAWLRPLFKRLDAPMSRPRDRDTAAIDSYRNQLFWQATAAEVLGHLRDSQAVEPLFAVMLDPAKEELHSTALLALIRIGKPSMTTAVELLEGRHQHLISHSNGRIQASTGSPAQGAPHVVMAAMVLGVIGRADAAPALIAAAAREKDAATRAIIARELTKLPPTDATKQAFKKAYESFQLDDTLPSGASVLGDLTEAAATLRDSTLVEWLLKRAEQAKGQPDDLAAYRGGALHSALKLARPAQLVAVRKAVDKYGTEVERRAASDVASLLQQCSEQADCYLAALRKPENQEHRHQMQGIKAAYMLALLGNEATRDELIASLGAIHGAAVRYAVSQTIDYLTPRRAPAVVAKLDAIITKNADSADRDKAAGDAPLKQVMLRIDARD